MKIEQVLVLIKPDGIKKSLVGNILTKFSESKLIIVGSKMIKVDEKLAKAHYNHLKDKPFFNELINYIQGKVYGEPWNRILAFVYHGECAISKIREIAGATNPEDADPISIRGSYGRITTKGLYENVVHCSSDSIEAAREIKLWFNPEEVIEKLYPVKTVFIRNLKNTIWA
ncbi:MAG: nucleoside-diphosphate kinase [Endomicrobium sp.]|jgi:nucleoside-diphosphate kinase|nr:nucleoside-diphosphate kinase [Endomicrobium sp.]